jgi:hypothetical protein
MPIRQICLVSKSVQNSRGKNTKRQKQYQKHRKWQQKLNKSDLESTFNSNGSNKNG